MLQETASANDHSKHRNNEVNAAGVPVEDVNEFCGHHGGIAQPVG